METFECIVTGAGDIAGKPFQVASAVGNGWIARLSAAEYLSQRDDQNQTKGEKTV